MYLFYKVNLTIMQIVHVLFILLCLISSSHIFITLTGLHSATLCFFLWDFREIHISDLCDKIIKKTSHISRWQPLLEILLVSCNYFTVCFTKKSMKKLYSKQKMLHVLTKRKLFMREEFQVILVLVFWFIMMFTYIFWRSSW